MDVHYLGLWRQPNKRPTFFPPQVADGITLVGKLLIKLLLLLADTELNGIRPHKSRRDKRSKLAARATHTHKPTSSLLPVPLGSNYKLMLVWCLGSIIHTIGHTINLNIHKQQQANSSPGPSTNGDTDEKLWWPRDKQTLCVIEMKCQLHFEGKRLHTPLVKLEAKNNFSVLVWGPYKNRKHIIEIDISLGQPAQQTNLIIPK